MNTKALHIAWTRSSALFMSAHQELENELKRMKLNTKVPQEFIEKKDFQIESLVEFYNNTEELMQAYKLAMANTKLENHFLIELATQKTTLAELMAYKPSLAIQLFNKETGEEHTLSSLKEG